MGKLIDDCELKEIIDGNENLLDWQKEEMKLCVDACDTAYDVDAVVKKLKKESYVAKCLGTGCSYINLDRAIDIVRRGGVK